jgi:hypothetical protein
MGRVFGWSRPRNLGGEGNSVEREREKGCVCVCGGVLFYFIFSVKIWSFGW